MTLMATAEDLKVEPVFYYKGPITVCLLRSKTDTTVYARGVAVCSKLDQFEKRTGRNKAMGRAIKALIHAYSSEEVGDVDPNYNADGFWDGVMEVGKTFGTKSTYLPALTAFEWELIRGK